MGASCWHNFAPYQADINTALQALRQEVFEKRGERLRGTPSDLYFYTEDELEVKLLRMDPKYRDQTRENWHRLNNMPDPIDTIENLVFWNEPNGTHTIIDMTEGVSEEPKFCTASPLTEEQLMTLFGTLQPTHEMVIYELDSGEIFDLRETWEGLYIIVFKDSVPDEICFAACSGD